MSLAKRIQDERKRAGLTLDQLAENADISKTYLWELEQDETGQKKPSADVLLKIANALSVTISDLLGLPTVQVKSTSVSLPSSLIAFRDQQAKLGNKLSDQDLRELATMRFRGAQPRTVDDWTSLYLAFLRTSTKRK
jgi:transcriptional regulator with XRE-family HTH domain